MNRPLSFFVVLLLTCSTLVSAGDFKYCCSIAKCVAILSACDEARLIINGTSCADACLAPISESQYCRPQPLTNLLTRNYTCFKPYLEYNDSSPVNYVCGATYSSERAPALPVPVTCGWCLQNCQGWSLSPFKEPSKWAAALLQFILPAIVFSMTIPRPRRFEVNDWFFDFHINEWKGTGRAVVSLMGAGLIVFTDTMIWVFLIFTAAGPMLVGGLHEALLDYRILHNLDRIAVGRRSTGHGVVQALSPLQQTELLVAVVCGNLDESIGNPQTSMNHHVGLPRNPFENPHAAAESTEASKKLVKTQARLDSLLKTQYSFGSIVGAPVLFYLGSFIYNVALLSGSKGDNATAHALAFGQWWMALVHVSIVSGCLLAANNPSTSTAIVAQAPTSHRIRGPLSSVYRDLRHQPVPLWRRGVNKAKWVSNTEAWTRHSNWWPEKVSMRSSWTTIASIAFVLILMPSVLGFIVSYTTPRRGLSCRSMTFLVYTLCQLVLIIITTVDAANKGAFYDDMMTLATRDTWRQGWTLSLIRNLALTSMTILALLGALFTGFAGTLMQIIGVYQNCLCSIPITRWRNPDNEIFSVSSDNAEARASIVFWIGCGVAAIASMAVVCYFGWWYQRYLRHRFLRQVAHLDVRNRSDLVDLDSIEMDAMHTT